MPRCTGGCPRPVAAAPAVFAALHAAATDRGGTGAVQGRGLSPAAPVGGFRWVLLIRLKDVRLFARVWPKTHDVAPHEAFQRSI